MIFYTDYLKSRKSETDRISPLINFFIARFSMKNISSDISNSSMINIVWYVSISLVLSLMISFAVAAEQAPEPFIEASIEPIELAADEQATQTQAARERPIEEISVVGERSALFLLEEIKNAEVLMYDIFNDLNSTDDFDVNCRNVTHTGTLIPEWECDSGFMTRERFQNTQDFLQFGFMPKSDEEMYWENREKVAALNAEMLSLAKENPGLAEAMLDLNAKRERLEEIESRKREKTKGFFSRLLGKDSD